MRVWTDAIGGPPLAVGFGVSGAVASSRQVPMVRPVQHGWRIW